jgi:hypothetical protein
MRAHHKTREESAILPSPSPECLGAHLRRVASRQSVLRKRNSVVGTRRRHLRRSVYAGRCAGSMEPIMCGRERRRTGIVRPLEKLPAVVIEQAATGKVLDLTSRWCCSIVCVPEKHSCTHTDQVIGNRLHVSSDVIGSGTGESHCCRL